MEGFKERLIKEHDDLLMKFQKLSTFIQTKEFGKLEEIDKSLLIKQKDCMEEYINILNERIIRLIK